MKISKINHIEIKTAGAILEVITTMRIAHKVLEVEIALDVTVDKPSFSESYSIHANGIILLFKVLHLHS